VFRQCSAPECTKVIEVGWFQHLFNCFSSLRLGAQFAAMYFCPEHNERITAGRISDGDPATNPDLNKCAKEDGTHLDT
jgi:hypothetical protein